MRANSSFLKSMSFLSTFDDLKMSGLAKKKLFYSNFFLTKLFLGAFVSVARL